MRVVSFVPSLTETFLEAGIDVVGRTRFCIHPGTVKNIPIIGGTKEGQWQKVRDLKPDLVVFDREENTREMAETCGVPFVSTHVTSVASLAVELRMLAQVFTNAALLQMAERAERLTIAQFQKKKLWEPLNDIPEEFDQILYMIWRNPWMAVSKDTFIGSVCELAGLNLPPFPTKYPKINLDEFSKEKTLLLFSSEPFPFRKHADELKTLGYPAALVDGENFSWFGIRSIRFLESIESSRG